MGGQTRVFTGKKPALVGDELPEQIHVLEVQGIQSEVDLRLGARRASLAGSTAAPAAARSLGPVGMGFPWHNELWLFDFAMHRVAPEKAIILLELDLLRFCFLVASGQVTGRRFALLTGLGAF
jgi:hypothetical protein